MKSPMDRNIMRFILSAIVILSISLGAFAQPKELPKPHNPPRLVNDYVGWLSPSEYQTLERRLVAYDDSTSIQIAIVIEETTGGEDIFSYSQRLATEWGIGNQGRDNGVLIMIATKDRTMRIHSGYGAEGFLPDNMSRRIIDQLMTPNFRQGKYYDGLYKATEIIMMLGTGEYQALERKGRDAGIPPELIFFIIVACIIVVTTVNKNRDHWDDGDDGGYYRGGRYEDYGRPHEALEEEVSAVALEVSAAEALVAVVLVGAGKRNQITLIGYSLIIR